MTALERLNPRPAPLHPSRRRAPARTAIVRSNSDTSTQNTPRKMRNKPAFHPRAGVSATTTLTLCPTNSLTSPLAPIEIP